MSIGSLYFLPVNLLLSLGSVPPMLLEEGKSDGIRYTRIVIDPEKVSFEAVGKKEAASQKSKDQILFFNGGFYEADGNPSGLLISKGKTLSSLSQKELLSGIFVVQNGRASIVWAKNHDPGMKPGFALQSGPLVVEPGAKKGILSNSAIIAERTILAVDKKGKIHLFIVRTPTGLIKCQKLLLKKIKDIDAAINLDGGPSTFLLYKSQKSKASFGSSDSCPYLVKVAPK